MAQPHPDPFALVGTILSAKYSVETLVAETELSIVYRANHRIWQRPVAIKAFKAPMLADAARDQMLESFVREGVLLMDLSERCSAICQARDVGSTITANGDWIPYMVLEWLDGEPLEAVLARERAADTTPRGVQETVRLLGPVAGALAVAHERHVVHGDVKPGNVLLLAESRRAAPRCKLVDFGIASVGAGEPLRLKSFTPAYGAPEQFDAAYGPTGPWTDVFALALTCVEVLSGREPLRGATLEEIGAEACDRRARPTARARGAQVSDEVEQVLARALAVDPEDRYPDARDFWTALRSAARDTEAAPSGAASGRRLRESGPSAEAAAARRRMRKRRWLLPALALAAGGTCFALERYSPWLPAAGAEARGQLRALQSMVGGHSASGTRAKTSPKDR